MATIITPGGSSGSSPDPGAKPTPSLHVDSDWKAQAQAEKERLAREEAERAAKQAPAGGPGQAQGEFPVPDFRALVDMLAMQAVMYMGGVADKSSGRAIFDPEYSRHMIDLLGVLEEKSKGNITPEEQQDLSLVLNELRLRYVELMKMVAAQAASKGVAGQVGPGGGMSSATSGFGSGAASIPGISSKV
ncbi:MAG: DUF1844 domain-containing protein [Planctomycetes bacterium]|nr:DUF1844 domain-containing protein [Planctomycetota bacterium]